MHPLALELNTMQYSKYNNMSFSHSNQHAKTNVKKIPTESS